MKRFIERESRSQITLLPECLDDYIAEDNPVRAVEAFIDGLDIGSIGLCWRSASGYRAPVLPPLGTAQALPVRVSQSHSVQPAAGAGVSATSS